jgi:hypothetical protein
MQSQHDRITTTIKRQWLAEIIAGRKKIEYRQIKPHWTRRLKSVTVPFELRLINGMKPRGSAESRSARCPIPAEALSLPAHDCVRVDDDQCSRHKGFARADGLLHRAQRQPAGNIRIPRSTAPAQKGASLRSHGTSDRRMGSAADRRGVRQSRC